MKTLVVLMAGLLVSACASLPSPATRRDTADALAARQGWQHIDIPARSFDLAAYVPRVQASGEMLSVYIEGDGFAWFSPSQPSSDPTPINPLGLKLALAQPDGPAAYLARPCQFVDAEASGCAQRYWTQQRFAPEVIAAEDQALDALKARFHAVQLTLVGYSGGAAVAALLAERRHDVSRLITVAGNLDPVAWTRYHHVEPLTGSLNPADARAALKGVRQWHFVGGQDRVVPPALVESFADGFPAAQRPTVRIEPGYTHDCCWTENWPRLIEQVH
ncbi:MAG: alpha/beta hydrolase [Hydrogenophilales bacterium]|nr:alpha/beta hydrolase [Hydrogenophilales bacterium]